SATDQQRAMICLINWTRRHSGLGVLRRSHALAGAAAAKAHDIDTCNQFAHTPCGMPAFKRIKGRIRAGTMGETLYAADSTDATAYAAYRAWLGSPGHRRVLLGRGFRAAGAKVAHLAELEGAPNMRVWVVAVADRRR
ncbi:MAG: CAP domain-containing protein, partial [Gaiella sp.]